MKLLFSVTVLAAPLIKNNRNAVSKKYSNRPIPGPSDLRNLLLMSIHDDVDRSLGISTTPSQDGQFAFFQQIRLVLGFALSSRGK